MESIHLPTKQTKLSTSLDFTVFALLTSAKLQNYVLVQINRSFMKLASCTQAEVTQFKDRATDSFQYHTLVTNYKQSNDFVTFATL